MSRYLPKTPRTDFNKSTCCDFGGFLRKFLYKIHVKTKNKNLLGAQAFGRVAVGSYTSNDIHFLMSRYELWQERYFCFLRDTTAN